jgi:putative ABC transport system ATP-binding protein
MAHRGGHLPSQLSGGQQQRVAVARAVAGEPAIVFADEPTGSLDSKNGDVVMDLLDELHRAGATLCIVTHSREYARRASRAIHLFDGSVVEDHTKRIDAIDAIDAIDPAESLGAAKAHDASRSVGAS